MSLEESVRFMTPCRRAVAQQKAQGKSECVCAPRHPRECRPACNSSYVWANGALLVALALSPGMWRGPRVCGSDRRPRGCIVARKEADCRSPLCA